MGTKPRLAHKISLSASHRGLGVDETALHGPEGQLGGLNPAVGEHLLAYYPNQVGALQRLNPSSSPTTAAKVQSNGDVILHWSTATVSTAPEMQRCYVLAKIIVRVYHRPQMHALSCLSSVDHYKQEISKSV